MCAINGISAQEPELVAQMNRAIAHRGPDDTGVFSDALVTLGHNRLSILDLSPRGHQPMDNATENIHITFNGEIYNFKKLRAELVQKGAQFTTETDTEVILQGYAQEGIDFFKKMRGMWALVIYDTKALKLIFARDPFGIKPLYYYLKDGRCAFSSELRGLAPALSRYGSTDDTRAHRMYFVYGYFPAPLSPFREVRKVLPGEICSFDLNMKMFSSIEILAPYEDETILLEASRMPHSFAVGMNGRNKTMRGGGRILVQQNTLAAARPMPRQLCCVHGTGGLVLQPLEEALNDSIRAHFVSDVPVGLFFSGGLDSTLLLAKARELGFDPKPFFLRIPNRLDNEYALAAAKDLGATLTIFDFDAAQALETFNRARTTLDEPFADTSYIPTEFLSSQVSETHKVVLSGEGGDEFFGGYHRHNHLLGLERGTRIIPAALVRLLPTRMRRAVESKINRDPFAAYLEFVRVDEGLSSRKESLQFLRERVGDSAYDELAFALDQTLYLPDDLLFKIDRAGMRHGLEGRVPFLDKKFFAAVRAFSPNERHGGGITGKAALKNILRNYLPERLVERPKQGFSFSLKMLNDMPPEILDEAVAEAKQHPELVPFAPELALAHPHLAYALVMWVGWRKSFFA